MATHDYVIDNSTGANVRADINNVLQAILTNNSSSSAPSTTAAYMWWADTTNGVLKIRNSSDNAWVELLQLDGTLTLEDGSVSAPALAFRDDLDTGIYSPSANTIAIATGGVERLQLSTGGFIFNEGGADIDFRIESDTNANAFTLDAGDSTIGINVSPVANRAPLHVHRVSSSDCHVHLTNTDTGTTQNDGLSLFVDSQHGGVWLREDAPLLFATHDTERYRVDGDGRFLIGHTTSTPMDNDANNPIFAVEGTGNGARIAVRSDDSTAGNGAFIYLTRTRGTSVGSKTTVQSGDALGGLIFMGADGTHDTRAAQIRAECDGTPGDNDMPGRIVFETTPDGGINSVEAMRIRSDKRVTVGGSSGTGYTGAFGIHGSTDLLDLNSSTSSGAGKIKFYEGGAGRMNIETLGGTSGLLIYDSLNAATRVKIAGGGVVLIGLTSSGGNVTYLETNQPQASNFACAMFQSSTSSSLSGTHALRIQGHGFNSAFQGAHGIKFVNADDQDRGYQAILFKKADASTNVGSISYNQNSTSYNTSSDYRLKENAVAISDGITRLKTLKPYRFNFKDNPSKTVDGFFAHECTAVPEAITGEKDGMKAESWYQEGDIIPPGKAVGMTKTYSSTEMEIQSLDHSKLVPLLVAAVQELITKVETLEAA